MNCVDKMFLEILLDREGLEGELRNQNSNRPYNPRENFQTRMWLEILPDTGGLEGELRNQMKTNKIPNQKQFILASASPRRKELFRLLGVPYRIMAAEGEEKWDSSQPRDVVQQLAARKAEEVGRKNPLCWVIGADTVVSFGQKILGKPENEQDAFDMLQMLQGGIHQVYTGVALFCLREDGTTDQHTFYERTDVEVYSMTGQEIWQYIRTGEPMDKAGAYGIQGAFCLYVKQIRGDYQNVVGLPVSRLYHEMTVLGIL